ncbi:MAG: tripartite tricarboxylate transporter substrate-binding protein [Actinomycetota bacterium]|nr:tripartite tricarboxylate transporter substrate-binding protein [Actinomycetota bacterium]
MKLRPRLVRPLPALVACALLLTACASDDTDTAAPAETTRADADACTGLEGEIVTLVVPYSPGGGYDSYARQVAPTLGEKIGATVVVENKPGAGGLLAINELLAADADGTRIAIMNGIGTGGASIAGAEGAKFELDQLSYIGRVAGDAQMIVSAGDGQYKTWEDVQAASGFKFGSTGPGASDFVTPSLLISVFDLDAKLVTGYEGSSEVELALLQGSVDGMSGQLDSRQAALDSGDQTALVTFDRERPEIAPNTPTVLELELDEDQKVLIEAHLNLLDVGRPLVGPPDMDEAALECLRGALAETVEDPELVAQAEEAKRPFNYLSGEELDEAITGLLDAPKEYVTVLTESFAESS